MPDEALSATVSTIEMFQSLIRLSTISIAATTKSVARSTSLAITGRSGRSLFSTNATSASTRGCISRVRGTGSLSPIGHVGEQHAEVRAVDAEHLLHDR